MPRDVKDGRTRSVGRQLQHRRSARQLLSPVSRVLLRALRPGTSLSATPHNPHTGCSTPATLTPRLLICFIKRRHFLDEHTHRPPIADDVMHREQRHMLVFLLLDEPCSQQRPARPGEKTWPASSTLNRSASRSLSSAGKALRSINGSQTFDSRMNDLHRLAIDSGEGRPQCFVTTHDLAQTALEGCSVQSRRSDARPVADCKKCSPAPVAEGTTIAAGQTRAGASLLVRLLAALVQQRGVGVLAGGADALG